jgi:hypothetical protein
MRYFLNIIFISLTATLFCTYTNGSQNDTNVPPQAVLDIPYLDLRSGFSINPPLSSQVSKQSTYLVPTIDNWEILKVPPSKTLIKFGLKNQTLLVFQLTLRQNMTLNQVLTARKNYWGKIGTSDFDNINIVEEALLPHNKRLAASLEIHWQYSKPDTTNKNKQFTVCETLIAQTNNRYFLISLIGSPNNEIRAVSKSIAASFIILNQNQVKNRWTHAKKEARILLESIKPTEFEKQLVPVTWYRMLYQGEDVGFHKVVENAVVVDGKTTGYQVNNTDYIVNNAALTAYTKLLGWETTIPGYSTSPIAMNPPAIIKSTFVIDNNLIPTNFRISINQLSSNKTYVETGTYTNTQLTIVNETLKMQDNDETLPLEEKIIITKKMKQLLLPQTHNELLGRLISREAGNDYIFIKYMHHTLGHYTVRVVANNHPVPNNPSLRGTYVIGKLNAKGPILEQWLDNNGNPITLRSHGITLENSTYATIESIWKKQMQEMGLLETTKPKINTAIESPQPNTPLNIEANTNTKENLATERNLTPKKEK